MSCDAKIFLSRQTFSGQDKMIEFIIQRRAPNASRIKRLCSVVLIRSELDLFHRVIALAIIILTVGRFVRIVRVLRDVRKSASLIPKNKDILKWMRSYCDRFVRAVKLLMGTRWPTNRVHPTWFISGKFFRLSFLRQWTKTNVELLYKCVCEVQMCEGISSSSIHSLSKDTFSTVGSLNISQYLIRVVVLRKECRK